MRPSKESGRGPTPIGDTNFNYTAVNISGSMSVHFFYTEGGGGAEVKGGEQGVEVDPQGDAEGDFRRKTGRGVCFHLCSDSHRLSNLHVEI